MLKKIFFVSFLSFLMIGTLSFAQAGIEFVPNYLSFTSQKHPIISTGSGKITETLILKNRGAKPFTITSLEIEKAPEGSADSLKNFKITDKDFCSAGIPAGGSCKIQITLDSGASGKGLKTAILRAKTNTNDEETILLSAYII